MKNLYTVKQTADLLQLNYRTVLRLIDAGFINSIRIGRTHRISQQEIDKFINSAKEESVIYQI